MIIKVANFYAKSRAETRESVAFWHVSTILGGSERSFLDLLPLPIKVSSINLPDFGSLYKRLQGTEWETALQICDFPKRVRKLSRTQGWRNIFYLPLASLGIIKVFWRALAKMRSENPGLIYSHGIKNHFILTFVAYVLKKPIIWHLQDYWPQSYCARPFLLWALRGNITIVCNSQSVADALRLPQKYLHKVKIIYNSIDPNMYAFSVNVERLRKKIGYVGMLVPWKGPHILIEAAHIIESRWKSEWGYMPEFHVIGGTPYEASQKNSRYLEKLHESAGKNIHFRGFLLEPRDVYQELDILCHTSVHPEPFGRVILEAMSSGVIVVAANSGGPKEILNDGENGYLHEPGNAESLAQILLKILNEKPEKIAILRENARKTVEDNFSSTLYRSRVTNLIQDILKNYEADA